MGSSISGDDGRYAIRKFIGRGKLRFSGSGECIKHGDLLAEILRFCMGKSGNKVE